MEENKIIIYNTYDGKASVSLMAKDGTVWMNQNQLAELLPLQSKISAYTLKTY